MSNFYHWNIGSSPKIFDLNQSPEKGFLFFHQMKARKCVVSAQLYRHSASTDSQRENLFWGLSRVGNFWFKRISSSFSSENLLSLWYFNSSRDWLNYSHCPFLMMLLHLKSIIIQTVNIDYILNFNSTEEYWTHAKNAMNVKQKNLLVADKNFCRYFCGYACF